VPEHTSSRSSTNHICEISRHFRNEGARCYAERRDAADGRRQLRGDRQRSQRASLIWSQLSGWTEGQIGPLGRRGCGTAKHNHWRDAILGAIYREFSGFAGRVIESTFSADSNHRPRRYTVSGASLHMETVPGAGWCPGCRRSVAITQYYDLCPACGQSHVHMAAGD
jgi:hypothetical protein